MWKGQRAKAPIRDAATHTQDYDEPGVVSAQRPDEGPHHLAASDPDAALVHDP
jgi:hypothetical protein